MLVWLFGARGKRSETCKPTYDSTFDFLIPIGTFKAEGVFLSGPERPRNVTPRASRELERRTAGSLRNWRPQQNTRD